MRSGSLEMPLQSAADDNSVSMMRNSLRCKCNGCCSNIDHSSACLRFFFFNPNDIPALCRLKKSAIDDYVSCFDYFFKKSLPLLHAHMQSEGVSAEMYLMDWNLALFTKVGGNKMYLIMCFYSS